MARQKKSDKEKADYEKAYKEFEAITAKQFSADTETDEFIDDYDDTLVAVVRHIDEMNYDNHDGMLQFAGYTYPLCEDDCIGQDVLITLDKNDVAKLYWFIQKCEAEMNFNKSKR